MKLFCFGFGQVAQSFVDHLLNCNVDLKLTTTSRKNTSELTFKNLKYFNYEFNENDFAVTDISHSKAIIEIEGKEAKEILKKGCPFNFGELEKNQCLNSTYNGMSVTIDMLNDDPDKFRIFGLRSFGESLYHSITDASLEFGYIAK